MGARRAGEGPGADPFLLVGRVRKPHGVRGELFVWVETDRPETVFQPGRKLWLGDDQAPDGETVLTVERSRAFKGGVLLKPAEFASRTEALDEMRGRSLYIPRSEAAPLGQDEVYYHELIGVRVFANRQLIGTVREVYETGGADLLAVERESGDELLIPFVRQIVHRVDVERGELEIDPPAGLLEL
jgi:16S rRNA processing protein RimM